jgi:hypothetical protein
VSGIGDTTLPVIGQGDVQITSVVNGKHMEGTKIDNLKIEQATLWLNRFLCRIDERSSLGEWSRG